MGRLSGHKQLLPSIQSIQLASDTRSPCPFLGIVKASASVVAPQVKDIVDDLYPRMLTSNPELRCFFNQSHLYGDPPVQRLAMVNCMIAYGRNIDMLHYLARPTLCFSSLHQRRFMLAGINIEIIAHKHCGLGVKRDHYIIHHNHLMQSFQKILSNDFTHEIQNSWSQALLALARVLSDMEEELYTAASERLGGWRGVKKFRVVGTRLVAKRCMELTFKPVNGGGLIDFEPGQFLTLSLPKGQVAPRHYSLTNAPCKDYLQCCTKLIPGGEMSGALHAMKLGDVVGLRPPFGIFQLRGGQSSVLCSAGIGATPMKCLLESHPARVKLVLHVDKEEATHPFKAEMEASGVETHFVYTKDAGRPKAAALVENMLKPFLAECDFFVCGPPTFITDMANALKANGAKKVNIEVFGPAFARASQG